MGSGVSTQQRFRKAIVIRAFNLRPIDQSIEEQFMPYTYLKRDQQLYINVELIKQCLKIGKDEYPWMEHFFQALMNQKNISQQVSGVILGSKVS